MGAGIAVMFKQKFKGVEELKNQSESDFLLKTSIAEKKSLTASQAIILFSSEKLLFILVHKSVDLLLENVSYSLPPEIITYCMNSVSIDANSWMHL